MNENQKTAKYPGDPLETALSKFVDAYYAGNAPDIDEFCSRFPGLLPQLKLRIETFIQAADSSNRENPDSLHPHQIGPYKILSEIGEGGMGTVYLAEQQEPVKRRVALKVIKPGMGSKAVIARFEAERQALAMMDHPAIAKIYEAGTTDQGQPFFAMEHIKGIPLTDYCDRQRLTLKERLTLFMEVCQGVQYAHQKAVIHRDLKPSNILVAENDGRPVPKIIDFGLAKAMGQKLTELSLFTEQGVLVGTPEYMSPEQADPTALDVDTRTDIYSLGVILYRLLTSTLPFSTDDLREAAQLAAIQAIRKRICEEEPQKPSTRVSSSANVAAEAAKHRRIDPTALGKRLRGDLDWITMKALEKDRARRYGAATDLAADLERHMNHEPVMAGPPSARYRAKKFLKKNAAIVSFAALTFFLLATGVTTTTVFYISSEKNLSEAQDATKAAKNAQKAAEEAEEKEREQRRKAENARKDAVQRRIDAQQNLATAYIWRAQSSESSKLEFLCAAKATDLDDNPESRGRLIGSYQKGRINWTSNHPTWAVAFHPHEDRILTGGLDGIHIWDASQGRNLGLLGEKPKDSPFSKYRTITSITINMDGSQFLSGNSHGTIQLWDYHSQHCLATLQRKAAINSTAYSPDGKRFVWAEGNGTVGIGNATDGSIIHLLTTHTRSAWSVSFSPNGDQIMSCVGDGAVRVWDSQSFEEISRLDNRQGIIKAIFSPDGSRIVSAGKDGKLRIWNARNTREVSSVEILRPTAQFGPFISDIVYSRDSKRIAVRKPGADIVLDARSLKELLRLGEDRRTGGVFQSDRRPTGLGLRLGQEAMTFDPSGRLIVSGGGRLLCWDAHRDGFLGKIQGSLGVVCFSTDNSEIISTGGRSIRTWNSQSADELAYLRAHEPASASFSPDSARIITGGRDGTVRIWNTENCTEVARLRLTQTHKDPWLRSAVVAYSSDGGEIAFGTDQVITVWNSHNHEVLHRLAGHQGLVVSVKFTPDGSRLISKDSRDIAILWDTETGKSISNFEAKSIRLALSHKANRIITVKPDSSAQLWDASTGELIRQLEGSSTCVGVSHNGHLIASAGTKNFLRIWEATSGKEIVKLEHESRISFASFSHDGSQVASGAGDTVNVWDFRNGNKIRQFEKTNCEDTKTCFTLDGSLVFIWRAWRSLRVLGLPDGKDRWAEANNMSVNSEGSKAASSTRDGAIRVWDTRTGKELLRIWAPNSISPLDYSPDGNYLLSGHGGHFRLWDAHTGTLLSIFGGARSSVAVAVTQDGKLVASGAGDIVRIWDTKKDSVVHWPHGDPAAPTSSVTAVRFGPKGKTIASAGSDGSVRIWEVESRTLLHKLEGAEGKVLCVAFTRDGNRLVSGGEDTIVRLWDLKQGKIITRFHGHKSAVSSVETSSNGDRIASGGSDGTVIIWGKEKAIAIHEGSRDKVVSIRFREGGDHILSANREGAINVWSAHDGREIARIDYPEKVSSMSLSLDGSRICIADTEGGLWLQSIEALDWSKGECLASAEDLCDHKLSGFEAVALTPPPTPDTTRPPKPAIPDQLSNATFLRQCLLDPDAYTNATLELRDDWSSDVVLLDPKTGKFIEGLIRVKIDVSELGGTLEFSDNLGKIAPKQEWAMNLPAQEAKIFLAQCMNQLSTTNWFEKPENTIKTPTLSFEYHKRSITLHLTGKDAEAHFRRQLSDHRIENEKLIDSFIKVINMALKKK